MLIDKPSVDDRRDILKSLTQQFKMVAQQVEDDGDDKTVEGETLLETGSVSEISTWYLHFFTRDFWLRSPFFEFRAIFSVRTPEFSR